MSVAVAGVAAALATTVVGVGLVRWGWRRSGGAIPALAGWTALLAATPLWALSAAWDKAIALTLLAPSLVAILLVVANAEVRRPRVARAPRLGAELPERSGEALWRAWARTGLGGPAAGAAALTLAAAWGLKGPGDGADRLGAALLLAPALWACGLIWATTDPRLARVAAGFAAAALIGGAWSRL